MEVDINCLHEYCRCCLHRSESLNPLIGASVDSMLFSLVGLKVDSNDGFPQNACSRCIMKLSTAFSFQRMVLASQETLNGLFQQGNKKHIQLNEMDVNYEVTEIFEQITNTKTQVMGDVAVKSIQNDENSLKSSDQDESSDADNVILEAKIANVSCIHCKCSFENKNDLKAHMEIHQETCPVCSKRINKHNKPRHMRTHSANKPHRCKVCSRAFADASNLRKHERMHAGPNANIRFHLCSFCGKKFKWKTSLCKHVRYHTGDRMRECDLCGKKFPNPASLTHHLRTHVPDNKEFVCDTCGSAFSSVSNLNRHRLTHGPRHKEPCHLCNKTYLNKYALNKHLVRKHLEQPDKL